MQLQDVNTTNIAAAIQLGCQTMGNVFNADDNDVPFFRSVVYPEARLSFSENVSEAHVPGRHLNALLTAEAVLGVPIPDEVIDKHARAAFFSYSGPVALPLNRTAVDGPLTRFLPHNIREGFHAFYALTRYRQSTQAEEIAERSIAAINQYWDPERGWNREVLEGEMGISVVELADTRGEWVRKWNSALVSGPARAIGPLVKYHRATGSSAALDLAVRLKDTLLEQGFSADGSYDVERLGHHTHSITCSMSSLAQLADLTNDAGLKARVRTFYERGLKDISDDLGWSIENGAPVADPDRGEANNTGDILETALLLGKWGDSGAYHHAERILRGHLLPSQLRDVSFIPEPPNPDGIDGLREVARRHVGAFGFPAPYGHQPIGYPEISFNMDIVGGAVASLCEAVQEIAGSDEREHCVNLLFDHETDALRVSAADVDGRLRVQTKRPGRLLVRIPPWADVAKMAVDGVPGPPQTEDGYLVIDESIATRGATVILPAHQEEIGLEHRTRTIRTRLRGDTVVAMDNFGADFTFFDPI
jgi:hypothetical protein